MPGVLTGLREAIYDRPALQRLLLGGGVVSSVVYLATDIVGSIRYAGYSMMDQAFSELTAEGSPVRSLMVALNEFPYTTLVSAFGVGVWALGGQSRAARTVGISLLGYALTGFVGGVIFPMSTRGTDETLRNMMHIPATAVMSVCILLAMGFGAPLLGTRFRYYTYATIAALLVFGILTSLQGGRLADNQATPWMGLEERVNIYATMLWIAILAIGLLHDQHVAAPRESGAPRLVPPRLRQLPH